PPRPSGVCPRHRAHIPRWQPAVLRPTPEATAQPSLPKIRYGEASLQPPGNQAARYSTANVAEGSMVCLEMLSFTLISIRYTPGGRFAAATDFCSVTCSPIFPIVSLDSFCCTTCLLVATLTMSYSNVAEGLCVFSSTPRL